MNHKHRVIAPWVERSLALGLFLAALGFAHYAPRRVTAPANPSAFEARRLDAPEVAVVLDARVNAHVAALEELTQSPLDLDHFLRVVPNTVVVPPQAKTNGMS